MRTHRATRGQRLAAGAVKGAVGAALTVLFATSALQAAQPTSDAPALPESGASSASAVMHTAPTAPLQREMTRLQCSDTGFGDAATPRSALIVRDGRLQHVSFDHGWSVFTGAEPGDLVAVCLSES